ncbi:MAG: nucleotidyltransferase family protein [Solirubrobacteraceae bacterium]
MIGGLVLAAGAGTRFATDGSKLLAELDGRPLLEHAIAAQCAVTELARVIVVLGARADDVLAGVAFGRAEPVVCGGWAEGQATSLKYGVAALRCGAAEAGTELERVLVTLGDQPRLGSSIIARFARLDAGAGSGGALRACYGGRPGHPVLLGPDQLRALASVCGDRGARDLLGDAEPVECSELGCDFDVDTPEDLEAMRHEARTVI